MQYKDSKKAIVTAKPNIKKVLGLTLLFFLILVLGAYFLVWVKTPGVVEKTTNIENTKLVKQDKLVAINWDPEFCIGRPEGKDKGETVVLLDQTDRDVFARDGSEKFMVGWVKSGGSSLMFGPKWSKINPKKELRNEKTAIGVTTEAIEDGSFGFLLFMSEKQGLVKKISAEDLNKVTNMCTKIHFK